MIDKAWVECEEMEAERVCSFFVGGHLGVKGRERRKVAGVGNRIRKGSCFFS